MSEEETASNQPNIDVAEIRGWVQRQETGFPVVPAPAYATEHGTPYLRTPGVALLARPQVAVENLADFLGGFNPDLNFAQYIDDPTPLPPAAQLCKAAGQICYASFGLKRTMNAEAERYFQNIKESGHGSVLEHAVFSFLFYGISRSVTHELIRHRAGFGFCLTGDVEVYSEHLCNGRREGTKKRSMARLYEMTKTPHGRSRLKLLRLRCLDEATGLFTQGKVKAVACSGIKPVFRVELKDGKFITCSKEHRFLTSEGWKPLEEIVGGLEVSSSGLAIYGKPDAEIMVNGMPIWARPDLTLDAENIASVCATCHHRVNGHELEYVEIFGRSLSELPEAVSVPRGKGHLLVSRPMKIKCITYAGEQMTYDLEMEGPNHNFVANGIVTHNSQVSQRYVSGRVLRFVERPEYQDDEELHARFERRIDMAAEEYEEIAERLLQQQKAGATLLSGEARTDLRKKVQQAARSVLPNETEAPIVTTANVRAWRHFIEMRANPHAEIEIRALAFRVYLCLAAVEPILFGDYRITALPDGTFGVETDFPKV